MYHKTCKKRLRHLLEHWLVIIAFSQLSHVDTVNNAYSWVLTVKLWIMQLCCLWSCSLKLSLISHSRLTLIYHHPVSTTISEVKTEVFSRVYGINSPQHFRDSSAIRMSEHKLSYFHTVLTYFTVTGPPVWNTLPEETTSAPSLTIFCQRLKMSFFTVFYHLIWHISNCILTVLFKLKVALLLMHFWFIDWWLIIYCVPV